MANKKDFATSTVLTAPSTPTAGTSLVVQSGHGARFPAASFYATVHPPSEFPTLDNAEKVLVTAKSTDTFTITRAQGDTTAQAIEAGWRISNAVFLADIPATFDDLTDGSTNKAFTSTLKTKLDAIEALADVTDAANVDAAGAVMNSDTTTASMSFVVDEDNMSSDSATKLATQQSIKAYVDAALAALATAGKIAQPGDIMPTAAATIQAGWLNCNGTNVSRTTYANLWAAIKSSLGTVTLTIASPAVFTFTAHGLFTGEGIYFTTTGALPTGITANTMYYVIEVTANTFSVATSYANALAGTKVNTSGTQSGTHTLVYCPYGNGDGSTTFGVPSLISRTAVGKDITGTFKGAGTYGGSETVALTAAQQAHMEVHKGATGDYMNSESGGGLGGWGINTSTTNQGQQRMVAQGGGTTGNAHNNLQPYLVVRYKIKT